MTTKPKLPDWTWQLEAGDMCKEHYDVDKSHCLLGWLSEWCERNGGNRFTFNKIFDKWEFDELGCIADYNDSHTLAHNARVWNTTMRRLGYDIDDEACL